MTKPLEQVKSELANKHWKDNKDLYDSDGIDVYAVYCEAFDSAISHLASVGVSGAWRLSVKLHYGQPVELCSYGEPESVEVIELLPVAAHIEQLKKQLAEAEKVISFYADKETYDLVRSQNPNYEFYCELPDSDIEIDSVNRSGYGGKTARQYMEKVK
jgi:hypothetical protein